MSIISQSIISQSIELSFQDCVVKSGIDPEIYELNFKPAGANAIYDLLYRDTDPTTNSSSGSSRAKRNYTRCENAGGWIANGRFRQLSGLPLALDDKQRPRRYFQPAGKTLDIFFPRVTVAVWELVARKAGLPMPEFPVVGLEGEALEFWGWVKTTNCQVILTEGEKKAAALISRGYAAIGLVGITTGYRVTEKGEWIEKADGTRYQKAIARELVPALQEFDTPGREIVILFDYRVGDYSQSQEFKAARTTAKLFKSAIAKIAILPGPDKGVDDFIVTGGDVGAIIDAASLQVDENWQLQKWRRSRKFSPDITSDSEYVDFPAPIPNTITCIKAGLGRGKTQWLKEVITAETLGKIFLLGHRNALLRGTSKRCGFYHIKFDEGEAMLLDPNGRVASCVDSLLKFMDDCADENCTVILDEVESVIHHILAGGTISASDRTAILGKFTRLLNSCSRLILLDGHLTDAKVAYIAGLAPGKAITKYENNFKASLPKVEIFKGSGAPLKASQIEAFKDLILKAERPAVFCDSSKDDAIAFYRELEEIHGPGTGLLLTADNSTEDLQAEFMDSPKESIRLHQWKFIVATPLLQDGVDISTPNYFSEVFGVFGGVVTVNSVCQMVRRVRHPVGNIKILCAGRGYSSSDGAEIYAARIQKMLAERMAAELCEFDPRPAQELYAELCDELKACPHHAAWFELKVLENLERPHLYDFVCELLRESGHEVLELDLDNPETREHVRVKEEVKEDYAEAVASAEVISISEAEKILSRQGDRKIKQSDIRAANRAVIAEQLPGIPITAALVLRLKKSPKLLWRMRNLWQFQNPEKAKQLRGYRWEEGRMKVFGSDHKKNSLILRAFLNLDLGKFLDCDRTFCNDSPEVLALAAWGKGNAAATLGLKLKNQTPIQFLQSLLAHLGVKLVAERAEGQQRQYRYKPEGGSLPEDFSELYAAVSSKMLQKWEEKAQKKKAEKRSSVTAGTIDSTGIQAIPPPPDFSIDKIARGGMEFEQDLEAPICQAEVVTSPELPKELAAVEVPELEPPIANLTGWVNRWGKWVVAKVIGWCKHGTTYRVEFQNAAGEFSEMFVFPENFRWDTPT